MSATTLILGGNAFRLDADQCLETAPLNADGSIDHENWAEPEVWALPEALVAELNTIETALRSLPATLTVA